MVSRIYRDPAIIYEQTEARTCKGCIHLVTLWGVDACAKKNISGKALKHCLQYKERNQNA
jgi:hypothetical protein